MIFKAEYSDILLADAVETRQELTSRSLAPPPQLSFLQEFDLDSPKSSLYWHPFLVAKESQQFNHSTNQKIDHFGSNFSHLNSLLKLFKHWNKHVLVGTAAPNQRNKCHLLRHLHRSTTWIFGFRMCLFQQMVAYLTCFVLLHSLFWCQRCQCLTQNTNCSPINHSAAHNNNHQKNSIYFGSTFVVVKLRPFLLVPAGSLHVVFPFFCVSFVSLFGSCSRQPVVPQRGEQLHFRSAIALIGWFLRGWQKQPAW